MQKLEKLYEGKAKKVFATDDENLVIVSYKDDARPKKCMRPTIPTSCGSNT